MAASQSRSSLDRGPLSGVLKTSAPFSVSAAMAHRGVIRLIADIVAWNQVKENRP